MERPSWLLSASSTGDYGDYQCDSLEQVLQIFRSLHEQQPMCDFSLTDRYFFNTGRRDPVLTWLPFPDTT